MGRSFALVKANPVGGNQIYGNVTTKNRTRRIMFIFEPAEEQITNVSDREGKEELLG
jgi:hypothetical protein